jgi:hypothetical protein
MENRSIIIRMVLKNADPCKTGKISLGQFHGTILKKYEHVCCKKPFPSYFLVVFFSKMVFITLTSFEMLNEHEHITDYNLS